MQITIDTSTASTGEFTALIALLASLGGRLPAGVTGATITGTVEIPARPAVAEQAADGSASNTTEGTIDPTQPDSTGVPWDARIHSTPASITKDGAYRKRRGISEVEFGRIHGELAEAAMAGKPVEGPSVEPAAPPPPGDDATEDTSSATGAGHTSEAEAPPPPSDDTGPNAESAPTERASLNASDAAGAAGSRFAGFPEFVQSVNAIKPGGIPYAELNTIAQGLGVPGFKDMKDRPDLWDMFFDMAGGQ